MFIMIAQYEEGSFSTSTPSAERDARFSMRRRIELAQRRTAAEATTSLPPRSIGTEQEVLRARCRDEADPASQRV